MPVADGRLEAGTLRIYDLHGRLAAQATFDGRSWSARSGVWRGPLHLYVFTGRQGMRMEGKIPPVTLW